MLFSLELDLAHPVLPLQSSYKVMSTKIEIKLKKAEGEKCVCKGQVWRVTVELCPLTTVTVMLSGVRWAQLEGDGAAPLPGGSLPPAAASSSTAPPPVKVSKRKKNLSVFRLGYKKFRIVT